MIESDYIERDMELLNPNQLKVLRALTDRYQPDTEIAAKTGLSILQVSLIMA